MKIYYILFGFLFCNIIIGQQIAQLESFNDCVLPSGANITINEGTEQFFMAPNTEDISNGKNCALVYTATDRKTAGKRKFTYKSPIYSLKGGQDYYVSYYLKFTNPKNSSLKIYSNAINLLLNYTSNTFTGSIEGTILKVPTDQNVFFTIVYENAGNDAGSQVIIDNFFVGNVYDKCSSAIDLTLDASCTNGTSMITATVASNSCKPDAQNTYWYKYTSNYDGYLNININADYNVLASYYSGTCNALQQIVCEDYDEFGFDGEHSQIQVQNGKTYFFRLSKRTQGYGNVYGTHCIGIKKGNSAILRPNHDLCNNRIKIIINNNCSKANNYAALTEGPVPSYNGRSKSDIWYSFIPTSTKSLEIISNADFAEVMTLYTGSCTALTEVKVEDLGNHLVLDNPKLGTEYFLQVSGYFASVEGNLCVDLKEVNATIPSNDDCIQAKQITLNGNCVSASINGSTKSAIRSSCTVYTAPDLWYSLTTGTETNIALTVDADFIYSWALFSGSCNSLIEAQCGSNPDPCDGYIAINQLKPNTKYFLQIYASAAPLKINEGNICVKIEDLSKATKPNPLALQLSTECLHGVLTRVNYSSTGGKGKINYYGPSTNELFTNGSTIDAFVTDENNCRDFKSITASCKTPTKCRNSNLDINLKTECIVDAIGRQTGEVRLDINGVGGSGAYFYYGTKNGDILKHGDVYKIILIDTDSCYVIEEGKIFCPPFNCSQSKMKMDVTYDCIDTLLKAQLKVVVTGNLGTYMLTGNQHLDLLDQGTPYSIISKDEADCEVKTNGVINCKFDSCAYSRATLDVSYECITNPGSGTQTGKAILKINGTSYAGGIKYVGNQAGDILSHNDSYRVELVDAFGCGVVKTGVIQCIPTGVVDQESIYGARIFPNPTNGKAIISLNVKQAEQIQITVYQSDGKELLRNSKLVSNGAQLIAIDATQFSAGIYYVLIKGKNGFENLSFIKI